MRAVLAAALALVMLGAPAAPAAPTIYSSRGDDPWNRIFALLFTRTIRVSPWPQGEPYDRFEEGDRAIEALEPRFMTGFGTGAVLDDPAHSSLLSALKDALDERSPRPALDRALMQADLWSAFDDLAGVATRTLDAHVRARAEALLPRISALIRHIALTRQDIASLPDNYAAARQPHGLPDVLGSHSAWVEIVVSPVESSFRMHDDAAQFRRASRVFVKPIQPPSNMPAFLARLPDAPARSVRHAVLLMQTLLVDVHGRVVPTRLVSDVQMRFITEEGRRGSSAYGDAIVHEYELSRRLLRAGLDGGFVHMGPDAPAYLSTAGNDYGFATPDGNRSGQPPRLATLKGRCSGPCHGTDGANFMTLNLTSPPTVVRLPQPNDDRARTVAAAKEARDDFKRLVALAFSR
jgi:hypothetical protein